MTVTAMPVKDGETEEAGGRRPLKLVLVLVVVLAVAVGAVWFFLLRPTGETEPVKGEVVALEPVQINLASGHYLRAGIALQLVEGAHEADGSAALDALIEVYSNTDMSELVTTEQREQRKEALMERLDELYHHEVMDVYFTEFVMQ